MAKRRKTGKLRKSQLVTTFGCGAMVDLPQVSGIISGIDNWDINGCSESDKPVIYEHNLASLLGKKYFIQPVTGDETSPDGFAIPIFIFPYYYYCPKCHALDKYWNIRKDGKYPLYCNDCGVRLVPSRFVVACQNGHIEDFPYEWWVHGGEVCDDPVLTLEYKADSQGLDGIVIKCKCGKRRSMANCMSEDALKGLKCKGNMPWIDGNNYRTSQKEKGCTAKLRTLQRTANNVYYPINVSALTIPPWSKEISRFLQKDADLIDTYQQMESMGVDGIKMYYEKRKIKDLFNIDLETLKKAINECFDNSNEVTEESLIKNEYTSLCLPEVNQDYFKISKEEVPERYLDYIEEIKLVKRLREVQVLKGFRRILPDIEPDEALRKEQGIKREFAPLSLNPNIEWLPATELFGEGIFVKLKEDAILKWEERVQKRYDQMAKRMPFDMSNGMFSPRFVLLHSLSHLLIRQLAYSCGYNTTSLKEKIYSTYNNDKKTDMRGILIYTAATDCDGSLGGLVREGRTSHFKTLMDEALQTAYRCSNDPICIESTSQGFASLNYAACHACMLLPETSCSARNCLLDRAALVGTEDDKNIAFFREIV